MNSNLPSPFKDEFIFACNGFTAQLCCSEESKRLAYQLRYESYLCTQLIEPNELGYLSDPYDEQINTRSHLIWFEGKPVASVRSLIWSPKYDWTKIENMEPFKAEIDQHIGLKENILESSRYAIAPDFRNNGRKSLFAQLLMFRIQDLSSGFDDCPHIITAVKARHVPFYERMLGFKRITGYTRYDWVDVDFALLITSQEASRDIVVKKGMPACTAEDRKRYASLLESIKI